MARGTPRHPDAPAPRAARLLWVALAGIVALGAASMLLVAGSSRPVPAVAGALPVPAPAAAEELPGASPARRAMAPPPLRPAASAEEAEVEIWAGAEPAATAGPWESIRSVERFPSLGRIGPGVEAALAELHRLRLVECFDAPEDPKLRRTMEEEAGGSEDTTPVLLLSLEAGNGSVRIAEADVDRRGDASERLLRCALSTLRGATLRVPEARAGARHRLRYRLAQSTPSSPF